MNEMFERNLPPYLAHDLAAWEKGVAEKSHLLDCLWGELYGGGQKINYVDFVKKNRDGILAPSLARILPRIDMGAIGAFIDFAPLLSDLQRRFYKTYLASRHEALFE